MQRALFRPLVILSLAVVLTAMGAAARTVPAAPLLRLSSGGLRQTDATPQISGAIPPAESRPAIVPGEVVVRLRSQAGNRPQSPSRAQTVLSAAGISASVQRPLLEAGGYVLGVPPGQEAAAAAALAGSPEVVAADPNLVRHIHGRLFDGPNDPLFPVQWHFGRINAAPAWAFPQTNLVIVAILDTGVDLGHPEFAGRILPGANFVTPGGSPQDDNGHGTHVAGIIAAGGNNGIGGAGVVWQARILPVKVADSAGGLTSDAWLNGLSWAVQNGAQVVNMSFGGSSYSGTEQSYIDDAWNRGAVIVASAGNSADSGNPIEYPAAYNYVLSVAATGADNSHAYYSESNHAVSVSAPGGDARFGNDPDSRFIVSTWPLGITSTYKQGYAREIGTSQAAPLVSGLAALMFSTAQGWTNQSVVQRIEATATDLGPPGRDDFFGFGLINVAAAVGNPPGRTSNPPPTSPPVPPPAPTRPPPTRVPPTAPPQPTPVLPPPTVAPPTPDARCPFTDACPGRDWWTPFIQDLARHNAVSGYDDHSFRPLGTITRGQVAKMIVLAAGFDLNTVGVPRFTDLPPTDPFYPYVETGYLAGVLGGFNDGTFRPYSPVTRGQLAKMLVVTRGWALTDPGRASFSDVAYGSAFYFYIETAAGLHVMPGFDDQTFRPDLVVTRAETAKIVDVALATFRPGAEGH